MRADLRLSKEEAQRIETSRAPKVNVASYCIMLVVSRCWCDNIYFMHIIVTVSHNLIQHIISWGEREVLKSCY